MHITLETDYAIRIIDCLARRDERLDAKTISDLTDVPQRFSLKILHKLVTGNIVKSFKGIHGGYEIGAELSTLSLYDVVELVEGTYRFSRCLDGDYNCSCNQDKTLPCAYQAAFSHISDMVCVELKKLTFDKFIKNK